MPEELRITIVDRGASGGGTAQASPPTGTAPTGRAPAGAPAAPTTPGSGPTQPSERTGGVRFGASQAQGIGTALATGNIRGALAGVGSAVASAGGALAGAVAGVTIGATAVAAGFAAAGLAARRFARTIAENIEQLAGLSVEVATAQAQTEIARFRAQFRRAERIGPELAAAERLRSRFESQIYDIGTEILKVLLRLADRFGPFFESVLELLESITNRLLSIGETSAAVITFLGKRWAKLFGLWNEERDRRRAEEEGDVFFREFQKMFPRDFIFFGNRPTPPGGPPLPIPGVAIEPGV